MNKQAKTNYPIHELLANRWSPRTFSQRSVSSDILGSLLEAARWAPSSRNEQPWAFIIATKEEPQAFEQMWSVLMGGNQGWAKDAAVLMIAVAKLSWDYNGKPNSHAWYDVGQAVAHLSIQAMAHNLYLHQMAGFYPDKAHEVYNIPEDYRAITALAIGYLGNIDELPDDLRKRELGQRRRKPLNELLFTGTWGNSAEY